MGERAAQKERENVTSIELKHDESGPMERQRNNVDWRHSLGEGVVKLTAVPGLVAVLAVLIASAGCNKSEVHAAGASGPPAPTVTVVTASATDVPVYLDEIGRNGAFESVTITPQVGGRITERHFEDGANLKKGELLFVIDPRPYQAQVDSAKANLAQAKANLELARVDFARDAGLIGTKAISKQDYDTKKSTVDVDEAQVEAAEAALETATINLDYCFIRSPIEGRAGARLVDVGNVVQANTSSLLLIQRLDPIYADFTITERDLPEVQDEMRRGALKAQVRLPSDPDNRARTGQLTFLDNAVQNGTGTVNLRATIRNSDHHFWPGQFVDVKLVLATQKGAVLVPSQATQISQKGPYVFVIGPDGTADLRLVKLGQRQGNDVVIANGVKAGERVVLTGQLMLIPGFKVHVAPASPTLTSSAQQQKAGSGEARGGS
jgi:membrane fusion protein, multidrug efflux system